MPNHCSNLLTIESENEDLIATIRNRLWKSEDRPITFEGIAPIPDELRDVASGRKQDEDGNWYDQWRDPEGGEIEFIDDQEAERLERTHDAANRLDWQRTHWGTKWDAYEAELTDESVFYLRYEFTTAWAPPTEFLQKLREAFSQYSDVLDITLEYRESGMGMKGTL
jgi:hypothetical protein